LQYCYLEKLGDSNSNIESSIWYEGDGLEMTHCKIKDTESRGIYVVRTDISLEHCVFEDCENAITITETGSLTLNHSDFVNCQNGIVQYFSGTGEVQVRESNFGGSVNFAIDNQSEQVIIDAIENYWGDPSGPTHSENIGGIGDLVSDSVDYGQVNTLLTQNQVNIGNEGIIIDGEIAQPLHIVDVQSDYNLNTRITNWSNIAIQSCDIDCDVNGNHIDLSWTGDLNFSEYADENLGNVQLNVSEINSIAISLDAPNEDLKDNNNDNDSLRIEVLVNPSEEHFAVQLDGSDDFIDISTVANDLSNDFTFETWFLSESEGSILEVLNGTSEQFRIAKSGGQIKIYEDGLNVAELSSESISNGYWHHLAYSKLGNTGTLILDGKLIGSHTSDLLLNDSQNWLVGTEIQGKIDELRIWSTPRNLEQIRFWWNQAEIEDESGLVAAIHFKEYFETRFYDFVNFNHAEVFGGFQIPSRAPVRDIDEEDLTPEPCYYINNGTSVSNCNLSVCNGTALRIGIENNSGYGTWSWSGPNDFVESGNEILVSNAMDETFNGQYRVLYEDENGFYAEQLFDVNSFDATNIRLEIQLDNEPQETTWQLLDELGNAVAFGGPYENSQAGNIISEVICAPTECGELQIFDAAGNGLCCDNGIGFYRIYDASEELLAYGSSFGMEDLKSICPEANEQSCKQTEFDFNSFESSWGIWNDGGANAVLFNYAPFASEGSRFVYLLGNDESANISTDDIELEGYDRVEVSFNFYSYFNSETSDNFKFQVSTDGGESYTTLQQWNYGIDFANDQYYPASIQIPGPFSGAMRFRIQGDVAANYIFIDEVRIETCGEAAPETCVDQLINSSDLETGWGLWNDGGNNSFRINNAGFASNGNFFILLRGNDNSSTTFTNTLDLSTYDEVEIDFNYYSYRMEDGDQWRFEISEDGGANYSTVNNFIFGTDYSNGAYQNERIKLSGPFTSSTRFRFTQAAGFNDYLLIDEIEISGCTNNNRAVVFDDADISSKSKAEELVDFVLLEENQIDMNVFPNPANSRASIEFNLPSAQNLVLEILDANGKTQQEFALFEFAGKKRIEIETSELSSGLYLLRLSTEEQQVQRKLIIRH